MGPFPADKWLVCHGAGTTHYIYLEAGQTIESGQPTVDAFDVEAEAEARATELGYQFPTKGLSAWDHRIRYHPGDQVTHNDKTWVATSHNTNNPPDDVPGDWDEVK